MRPLTSMTSIVSLLSVAIVLLLFATAASATPIGDLKLGSGGVITLTLGAIAFSPDPSANPPGPPGNAEVATGTSLTFAGCASGVLGSAGCLDSAPFGPNEAVKVANGVPIVFSAGLGANNPFLQFAGNGVTHAAVLYTATDLGAGSANTVCVGVPTGQSCSPFAGSPLLFINTGTGTIIGFSAFGTATDGVGTSTWLGQFTVPFAGETPFQIQEFFCPSGTCLPADFTSGRTLTRSLSTDILASSAPTTVPEPGSLFLLGSALASMAGVATFRRENKKGGC
jgi:hypothetical protein